MNSFETKRGPHFEMWAIGVAAGVVAAAVMLIVGGFGWMPSIFVGVMVALVIGVVFGLPKAAPVSLPLDAPVEAPVAAAPAVIPVVAAPVAAPAPVIAAQPPVAAQVMAAATGLATPATLAAARGGKADDLKIIKGIGPKMEMMCHKLGFFHFDQMAGWSAAEVAWVDDNLEGFKGRATRDRWVPQAKAILQLGPDEFLRQLDAGKEF